MSEVDTYGLKNTRHLVCSPVAKADTRWLPGIHPTMWECSEVKNSVSSIPVWSIQRLSGQSQLHKNSLSKEREAEGEREKEGRREERKEGR